MAQRLGLSGLIEGSSSISKPTIVAIAGTNGKGSCVAALEALLINQGQTVGAYTSPHLLRYNERIKIDGVAVEDDQIRVAFTKINEAREGVSLSYFEFGTLAAFLLFKQKDVDYWLLEVGLGGRLDAVNCLDPDLAIITSISLDHQNWLGDTREKIALEKAGILRAGLPFICSDEQAPFSLLDASEKLMCDSFLIGEQFGLCDESVYYTDKLGVQKKLAVQFKTCKLPRESLAAAIQAFALLGFSLAQDTVEPLVKLELSGRQSTEILGSSEVVLDVAHNPAAAQLLADSLRSRSAKKKYTALVAFMADKDICSTLKPLLPLVDQWRCLRLKDNNRAASAESVAEVLASLGVSADVIDVVDSVEEVLEYPAITQSEKKTIVFGSFITVAAVQEYLNKKVSASG